MLGASASTLKETPLGVDLFSASMYGLPDWPEDNLKRAEINILLEDDMNIVRPWK